MNKIKLLSRLQDFFNADEKEKKKRSDEIEDIIKKLRVKERKIKEMLDECQDDGLKKALQLEADIIKAHIDKGMAVLENL